MLKTQKDMARIAHERSLAKTYAMYGFHYRTIASRIYGKGMKRYTPTKTEIGRIGRYAREEGFSSMLWRRGESPIAKQFLAAAPDMPMTVRGTKLKLSSVKRAG